MTPCRKVFYICLSLLLLIGTALSDSEPKPYLSGFEEPFQLVGGDEFNGTALDRNVWDLEPDNMNKKKMTYRGEEGQGNVKVENGNLELIVLKESIKGSIWTAASLNMKKPIENGAYVECRFKPTESAGVNNAFWLASRPFKTDGISDRYEVDVVETKLDVRSGIGKAHLAWHDWKGIGYIRDKKNNPGHIALGCGVDHEWNAYQVWGFQIEEGKMRWFLNGKEIWNGESHDNHDDQHRTGIGKFQDWFPNKEKEAYGRFGQADWDYRMGYNGDRLNVLLAITPWQESWSPTSEKTHQTSMKVDYVRIFMPERLLNKTPLVTLPFAEGKVKVPSLFKEKKGVQYYGLSLDTTAGEEMKVHCLDEGGEEILTISSKGGTLSLNAGSSEASSERVMPATWKGLTAINHYKGPMQLILRVTPSSLSGRSVASVLLFPCGDSNFEKEPLWYHNVDERGNTSVNNQWHLNLSMSLQKELSSISMEGVAVPQKLKIARNYRAVVDSGK